MGKYYIEEDKWKALYEILCKINSIRVRSERATRRFVEAVHYILRTGSQWRYLPKYFGKYRTIHKRYFKWSEKGVWNKILSYLSAGYDQENIMIDSTIIRAHPCAAGYEKNQGERECLGRSKGGFTTKIHAVVDGLGQGLRFILTAGQRNDITQAENLIAGIKAENIIADKGYDSNLLIQTVENQLSNAVIPPKRNRKNPRDYDQDLYKERHLIECFFNKIKHFRRVFSRFDKKASIFASFVTFAAIIIWLR
jgi:transposase